MNINKPEIKKYFFLTIICHKLQTIFFLPLTLIHTNSQFGCSICGRPKLIRQCQNCFGIVPEKYKLPSLVLFFFVFQCGKLFIRVIFYHLWIHSHSSLLISTRGVTSLALPDSTQCSMDPSWVESVCRLLLKQRHTYIVFLSFVKTSSSQFRDLRYSGYYWCLYEY